MKMKYLSLAVSGLLSATALTACGGDGGDTVVGKAVEVPTQASQQQLEQAKAEQAKADQAKIDDLNNRLNAAQVQAQQAQQAQAQAQQAQAQADQATQDLQAANNQVAALQDQLAKASNDTTAADLRKQLADAQAAQKTAEDNLRAQNAEAQRSIAAANQAKQDAQNTANDLRNQLNAALQNQADPAQIKDLQDRLTTVSDQLARAVQAEQDATQAKDDANARADQLVADKNNLQARVNQLQNDLANAQNQPTVDSAEVERLRAELAKAKADLANEQNLASVKSIEYGKQIAELGSAVNDLNNQLQQSEAALKNAQDALAAEQQKPTADPAEIERLQNQLAQAQANLQTEQQLAQAKSIEYGQALAQLGSEKASVDTENAELQNRIDELNKQIEDLKAANPKTDKDKSSMKDDDNIPKDTKVVDPNSIVQPNKTVLPVVNNVDLTKQTTVGGQSYIRKPGANFDYENNTQAGNHANPTNVNSTDLVKTTPGYDKPDDTLGNIFVGQQAVLGADGKPLTYADGSPKIKYRYVGLLKGDNPGQGIEYEVETLQVDPNSTTEPKARIKENITEDKQALFDVNRANVSVAADGRPTENGNFEANFVQGRSGLVYAESEFGTNANDRNSKGLEFHDGAQDLTTRYFGNKYNDASNNAGKEDSARYNSYQFRTEDYNSARTGAFTVTPIVLENVQYGRVSSNIDALTNPGEVTGLGKNGQYVGSNLLAQKEDRAVSTYFYRGLNQTSREDMQALKERLQPEEKTLTYRGHAITYGLTDRLTNTATPAGNILPPNATALTDTSAKQQALGSFVKADYNVSTGNVVGDIFNVVRTIENEKVTKTELPVLIHFEGSTQPYDKSTNQNVDIGNTIVGTATRKVDALVEGTPTEGVLRGAFYGANAEELGGQVNSVEKGYSKDSWGAVFGAKRDEIKREEPTTPPQGDNPNNNAVVGEGNSTGVKTDSNDTGTSGPVVDPNKL